MTIHASEDEILAARAYENLHVPALFQQFAPRVAAAAGIQPGHRILDIACGTGVLTREVARLIGQDGFVAGLDATPGMLVVARELAPFIEWQHGTADDLPHEDETFDVVVSQFGMMFFPDRPAAISEILRVLVPGGRFAVAVWDMLEASEAYPEAVALLERLAGPAAADALRAPFVLGDTEALGDLFLDSGADAVAITTHHGTACFPSLRTMVEADLRGWLPVMGVNLPEDQIELILAEAEQALEQYVTSDGTVQFDAPAHIVTGRRINKPEFFC